jgi:hypothetical protein
VYPDPSVPDPKLLFTDPDPQIESQISDPDLDLSPGSGSFCKLENRDGEKRFGNFSLYEDKNTSETNFCIRPGSKVVF